MANWEVKYILPEYGTKYFYGEIKADNQVAPNKQTQKGDYVFNLCVFDKAPTNCNPGALNSDALYSNRIYQVTVRVK